MEDTIISWIDTSRRLIVAAAVFAALPQAVAAQDRAAAPAVAPRHFVSDHRAVIGGRTIRYRASVDENLATNDAGQPVASIYTFSYERTDVKDRSTRPVIFAFNGGPGSSSLWLHLGLLGPRRLASLDALPQPTVAPFSLEDNADSPLDVADVVLIDPAGTGYSRVLPGGTDQDVFTTEADAKVTVRLIEAWLRSHGRMNAPKYLISESYGTVRAAVVARLLAGGPTATGGMEGITLNGIFMVGPALDMTASSDLVAIAGLPTLAATACHFGKVGLPCSPDQQVSRARALIGSGYLEALYAGAALAPDARLAMAEKLSVLTGLPASAWVANDLRIAPAQFSRLLLADQGKVLGMYDARFTLPAQAAGSDPVADDPAMGTYVPGFVALATPYMQQELGVRLDQPYEPIAFAGVNGRWDYGAGKGLPSARSYATDLAIAMRRNPSMRVVIASGYYDLVTTLEMARYSVTHARIAPDALTFRTYPSGHMAYLGKDSRLALAKDLRRLVTGQSLESETR